MPIFGIEVVGRVAKGKYQKWLTPDGRTLLEAWARDGLIDKQIAHNMGIARDTLYTWKKNFPDISDALSRGKEIVDVEVENALLKKAKGYNAEVHKTFKVKEVYYDSEGRRCEKEHLEIGVDEVHVPADTLAEKYWLSNRRPGRWRDRIDPTVPVNPGQQDDGFLDALNAKAPQVWDQPAKPGEGSDGDSDEKD